MVSNESNIDHGKETEGKVPDISDVEGQGQSPEQIKEQNAAIESATTINELAEKLLDFAEAPPEGGLTISGADEDGEMHGPVSWDVITHALTEAKDGVLSEATISALPGDVLQVKFRELAGGAVGATAVEQGDGQPKSLWSITPQELLQKSADGTITFEEQEFLIHNRIEKRLSEIDPQNPEDAVEELVEFIQAYTDPSGNFMFESTKTYDAQELIGAIQEIASTKGHTDPTRGLGSGGAFTNLTGNIARAFREKYPLQKVVEAGETAAVTPPEQVSTPTPESERKLTVGQLLEASANNSITEKEIERLQGVITSAIEGIEVNSQVPEYAAQALIDLINQYTDPAGKFMLGEHFKVDAATVIEMVAEIQNTKGNIETNIFGSLPVSIDSPIRVKLREIQTAFQTKSG